MLKPIFQHKDEPTQVRPREVGRPPWPHLSAHVGFMTPESTRQRGQPSFRRPMY